MSIQAGSEVTPLTLICFTEIFSESVFKSTFAYGTHTVRSNKLEQLSIKIQPRPPLCANLKQITPAYLTLTQANCTTMKLLF